MATPIFSNTKFFSKIKASIADWVMAHGKNASPQFSFAYFQSHLPHLQLDIISTLGLSYPYYLSSSSSTTTGFITIDSYATLYTFVWCTVTRPTYHLINTLTIYLTYTLQPISYPNLLAFILIGLVYHIFIPRLFSYYPFYSSLLDLCSLSLSP